MLRTHTLNSPWSTEEEREIRRMDQEKIFKYVRNLMEGYYRTATAGEHTCNISSSAGMRNMTAESISTPGERYSRRTWHRRTDSQFDVTIHRNWKSAVLLKNFQVLNGKVTLYASHYHEDGTMQSIRAVWVEQGRGFGLSAVRGTILIIPGKYEQRRAVHTPQQITENIVNRQVVAPGRPRCTRPELPDVREPARRLLGVPDGV